MKLWLLAAALAFIAAGPVAARPPAQTPVSSPVPIAAAPADVASEDAIVAALYDVISGDAGVVRDWSRFRSLFHPSARLTPSSAVREGVRNVRPMTPDEYIVRSEPFLVGQGFHEREIARRVERFGHIAHVWSTYDSRHSLSDPQPFARGINSIQLLHDGVRWWVLSVYWQAETPDTPIPAQYLPPAG